jgi:formiminotetrahydrofolate cyclodeaminase
MHLLDKSLRDFTASLAARTPTPGGGSVAALNAAIGLGLVAMAARFTSGRKYEAIEAEATAVANRCDDLRARASALVDEDTAAYDAVTSAYGLPKNTDAEKAARTQSIQKALVLAMAVPAETIDVAMQGLEVAAAFASKSNKNLASDVLVGSGCLVAAVEGARANVRINAVSLADAELAKKHIDRADAAYARSKELHQSVVSQVEPVFQPPK